ncbi:MAG: metallophosphoesterase [Erysipelotrichaceae bacterium]|nr:metallophosphoesterase [Erysipelotrichaceae bacterium]
MKKSGKRKRILIIAAVAVLLLIAGCVFEVYRSSNHLTVNEYAIDSEKIETPVKMVIISDLHDHDFKGKLEEMIREQNPDLILMDGDMINGDTEHPEQIYRLIADLKDTAPVYFAVGNHEKEYMKNHSSFIDEVSKAGCIVLDKEYTDLNINGNHIRLGGLYDYPFGKADNKAETASAEIQSFMNDYLNTEDYKIMLAHRPDSFIFGDVSQVYDIDLVVSGHIHGGQVIIPFIGGLYGGDQGWFPEYDHGLYDKDKLKLIITSGLGSSKKKLPRFNNIPEILVLTVR